MFGPKQFGATNTFLGPKIYWIKIFVGIEDFNPFCPGVLKSKMAITDLVEQKNQTNVCTKTFFLKI